MQQASICPLEISNNTQTSSAHDSQRIMVVDTSPSAESLSESLEFEKYAKF